MTTVTFFRKNGRIVGFEASEHTGYSEEGTDIVCSAVSALTITTVNGLQEYLKIPVGVEFTDGYIYCTLQDDISDEDWAKAEILLETLVLGLNSIVQEYANNLNTIEREV